jgi:hypothetical protein
MGRAGSAHEYFCVRSCFYYLRPGSDSLARSKLTSRQGELLLMFNEFNREVDVQVGLVQMMGAWKLGIEDRTDRCIFIHGNPLNGTNNSPS